MINLDFLQSDTLHDDQWNDSYMQNDDKVLKAFIPVRKDGEASKTA